MHPDITPRVIMGRTVPPAETCGASGFFSSSSFPISVRQTSVRSENVRDVTHFPKYILAYHGISTRP